MPLQPILVNTNVYLHLQKLVGGICKLLQEGKGDNVSVGFSFLLAIIFICNKNTVLSKVQCEDTVASLHVM